MQEIINSVGIDIGTSTTQLIFSRLWLENQATSYVVPRIELAKWKGLKTVSEGVETKEQVERLRSLGCDYIQGYYYSKPISKADFEAYLLKEIE